MAKKRRRVSGNTAKTVLWVGAGVAGAFLLYNFMKSQQPQPVVIRQTPTGNTSSAATTATEVAAGASVLTTIANDLFGSSSDSSDT